MSYQINFENQLFFDEEYILQQKKRQQLLSSWLMTGPIFNPSNIGIETFNYSYIEVNDMQRKDEEYKKIQELLNNYLEVYSKRKRVPIDEIKIDFINYGKTELVYVLSEKNGNRVALLVKQPCVEFGKIKQEADYLFELNSKDSNVIAPIDYYQFKDQELYVTPYINQSRCIASDCFWGMYIPEPYYRFEQFSLVQEKIVNMCMIAKLVCLYDFEKKEGICSCKLGGGDFMLPKDWEKQIPTVENTFNNLYLIAAREKVQCSFEEYISIIKDEFSRTTIYEKQEDLIINLRGRVAMQLEDIESGIELGKDIINNRNSKRLKKD